MRKTCVICNTPAVSMGAKETYNAYTTADPSGKSSGLKAVYHYLKCTTCGLWWVSDPIDSYEEMYRTKNYWTDYHKSRGWGTLYDKERIDNDVKYAKLRTPEIKKFVKEGAQIYEAGCSTGALLKELKLEGFAAMGYEPSRDIAKFASDFSKCSVEYDEWCYDGWGRGTDLEIQDETDLNWHENDMFIALDVMEHLRKPLEEINFDWSRRVKMGGFIFLELPTTACESGKAGLDWHMSIPQEHIYHYNEEQICTIFNLWGFDPVEVSNPYSTDRMRVVLKRIKDVGTHAIPNSIVEGFK